MRVIIWKKMKLFYGTLSWVITQLIKLHPLRLMARKQSSLLTLRANKLVRLSLSSHLNLCKQGQGMPKCRTFLGRLLALPASIRLSWKCLVGANVQAYKTFKPCLIFPARASVLRTFQDRLLVFLKPKLDLLGTNTLAYLSGKKYNRQLLIFIT
jgi:hypothetical protein